MDAKPQQIVDNALERMAAEVDRLTAKAEFERVTASVFSVWNQLGCVQPGTVATIASDTLRQQLHDSLKQSDPPLGDIRWLIERPVAIPPRVRPGTCDSDINALNALTSDRKPLIKYGAISREQLRDMPSAYEREHVVAVLHRDNGVWFDSCKQCWVFEQEF